jgi:hypothetical protein
MKSRAIVAALLIVVLIMIPIALFAAGTEPLEINTASADQLKGTAWCRGCVCGEDHQGATVQAQG